MDLTSAIPVFLITLREGVEAALIVGIVMACLSKAKATHLFRSVYVGIGAGIGVSVVLGLALTYGIQSVGEWRYGAVVQHFLKGIVAISAIGLLSWMLIWMTNQARGLKQEIEASVTSSLAASTGIFSLIFIDVLREGVETVLFVGAQEGMAFVGAIGGILTAVMIGVLIFRGGVRINLKQFFQIMGVVLLLIVGGLVITALRQLDAGMEALNAIVPGWCHGGDSCILGRQIWDLTTVLPDRQMPGILLKTLFGYREKLYFLQGFAYVLFLATAGTLYWRSLNRKR
jgi:high-affinity iron transporter